MSIFGRGARLEQVFYFSALAKHIDARRPGTTARHQLYIECLQATGIHVEMSRFKKKDGGRCKGCGAQITLREEKETDVALSAKLFELFQRDECDRVVLVTGDTDLAPAVKTATALFPGKSVSFAFPFRRKNDELAVLAPGSFLLKPKAYVRYQLPDTVRLPSGREVVKPTSW